MSFFCRAFLHFVYLIKLVQASSLRFSALVNLYQNGLGGCKLVVGWKQRELARTSKSHSAKTSPKKKKEQDLFTTSAMWWSFCDPPWTFACNITTPYSLTCVYMPVFTQESEIETEKAFLGGQREEKDRNKSAVPKSICTLFFNASRSMHSLWKGETIVLIPQALICTFVHLY